MFSDEFQPLFVPELCVGSLREDFLTSRVGRTELPDLVEVAVLLEQDEQASLSILSKAYTPLVLLVGELRHLDR